MNSGPVILDCAHHVAPDPAGAEMRRALTWEAPLLPELAPGTVRRWEGIATWIPPETHPLCRHRALASEERVVTIGREPPEGHQLEFDLGVLHRFAMPGTLRLVDDGHSFTLTDDENRLGGDLRSLGFVEQAPFPMLEALELRRMPPTGQDVLVASRDDPLYGVTEHLGVLGWIEPLPIKPRRLTIHTAPWGVRPLRRYADKEAWRHRYRNGEWADKVRREPDMVTLGALQMNGQPGLIALRRRADGRLETDLAGPAGASADPRVVARWLADPLRWAGRRPQAWAVRAAGSRARHLARGLRSRRDCSGEVTVLGWLRPRPAPGFSPLFSATQAASGDQFVTRSEVEAEDLGYEVDGILGFISDAGLDRSAAQPAAILWGSRFGEGRRYIEGVKER